MGTECLVDVDEQGGEEEKSDDEPRGIYFI
jgi:hypothetical protein